MPIPPRRLLALLGATLVAGALVFSPALRSSLWLDDHIQAAMVDGRFPAARGPLDLYDFVGDADRRVQMDRGTLPWWSHPHLKMRFFRPLSSVVLHAEHRLFHHAPGPLHLGSLAWWAAAVVAAWTLYRRVLGERAAAVATAIFALAPCHALPLAWVAHRTVLMSLAFGAAAVGWLARTTERAPWRSHALAALFFTLSLASGEYGLCFGGYALAFALAQPGSAARKAARLAPFAVPAAAYLALRAHLGYGAEGSGFYRDPSRAPAEFLAAAPRRLFSLLTDAWLTRNVDGWDAVAPAWALALIALTAVALYWKPMRAAARAAGPETSQNLGWLAWGSILGLLPVLPSGPSARLLAGAMLGVAPLVATLLDRTWLAAEGEGLRDKHARVAAALMGLVHLVNAPLTSWWASGVLLGSTVVSEVSHASLRRALDAAPAGDVIVVRGAPEAMSPFGFASALPPRFRLLAVAVNAFVLRVDQRTLDISIPQGQGFLPIGPQEVVRSGDAPVREGDEVDLPGLHVTVLAAGDAGPAHLRFTFDRSLDDPSFTWVAQTLLGTVPFPPPPVGVGLPLGP